MATGMAAFDVVAVVVRFAVSLVTGTRVDITVNALLLLI